MKIQFLIYENLWLLIYENLGMLSNHVKSLYFFLSISFILFIIIAAGIITTNNYTSPISSQGYC